MSGALPERVFGRKIQRLGFTDIEVHDRTPFGLDDVGGYPLFTPELLELMRRVLPPERHDRVAYSVVVTARAPLG